MTPRRSVPIWRDARFWRVASQIVFLAGLAVIVWFFLSNMQAALHKQGIKLGFGFLRAPASFAIGQSTIPFDASHPYARAFLVGLINTAIVAVLGIALATPLGMLIGVARLSDNWLLSRLATVYVEVMRNTPLLLQMVFWYFAVFLSLPPIAHQVVLPGPIFLNNRGVSIPWFVRSPAFGWWLLITVLAAVCAVFLGRWLTKRQVETGRKTYGLPLSLLVVVAASAVTWGALPEPPFTIILPRLEGTLVQGGVRVRPEMMAVLVSLVTYTAAFISEIVRAGIQAVSKGQVEAARALGLSRSQVLRLVIFPQALRVIIPPLTSQYLNLTKNSSLAIAVGYDDLFNVSTTVFNQTGRVVEVFLIVMLIYLTFSLITSLLMNLYNRAIRLVER